jgi:hypothetical protein
MSSTSCAPTDWYSVLSPTVEKLETLCRLSPLLDSDREQAQVLSVLTHIMADYVSQLRGALETLAKSGR